MKNNVGRTRHISPVSISRKLATRNGHPTGRVSKQQWLDAGLEILASGGVDAVRVVDLARVLDISKSGFYWHFKSREELLEDMKQYWIEEYSQQIITQTLQSNASLSEKLTNLVQTIREREAGKYDLAFTSWGDRDALIRELVDHVRDMRIAFVKRLLVEEGYVGNDLEARARLFVVYFSWSEVMFRQTESGLEGEPLDEVLKIIAGTAARKREGHSPPPLPK